MSRKRMRGVVDPLTIGFLIALGSTAAGVTKERADERRAALERPAATAQATPDPRGDRYVRPDRPLRDERAQDPRG